MKIRINNENKKSIIGHLKKLCRREKHNGNDATLLNSIDQEIAKISKIKKETEFQTEEI